MKEKIKLIIIQLIKITLGLLLISFLLNLYQKNESGLLLIFIVLLFSYLFIIGFLLINGGNKENWNNPYKNIELIILFGGFFGLLAEHRAIYSILNYGDLFVKYAITGAIISILYSIIQTKLSPISKEKKKGVFAYFGNIIGFSIFAVFLATTINRTKTFEERYKADVKVLEKVKESNRDDNVYFIYVNIEKGREKLKIEHKKWEGITVGDNILIEYKEGILGYFVIQEIK